MPRPSGSAAVWTARCARTRTWRACILSPRSRGCITARSSNPRITWGAFAPDAEGRLQMPVTLLVHHALADGSHIAKFYDALRAELTVLTGDTP